ncbi:hypothetical protein Peur_073376 [Populus x canadensis]
MNPLYFPFNSVASLASKEMKHGMLVQILSRVLKNIQSLQGIQMSNELSLLHLGCEKMVSGHWTKKATKVKVYLQKLHPLMTSFLKVSFRLKVLFLYL